MRKKGSLQLSINAIVIIILAITLLGLGLTFVRNFMGKGSEQFMGIIEGVEMENRADSSTPLTIPRNIVLKGGESKTFDVGFYCSEAGGCGGINGARPYFKEGTAVSSGCVGTGETPDGSQIDNNNKLPVGKKASLTSGGVSIQAIPTNIAAHEDVGYRITLESVGNPSNQYYSGKFVCNLEIADADASGDKLEIGTTYETEQIFITLE